MRRPVPSPCISAGLAGAAIMLASPSGAASLDRLRWTARPVVILSDSRDDPRVARQMTALDHEATAVGARQIKVMREARRNGPLRRSLGVEVKGFAVVLVGKDGDVKGVWHDLVAPKEIFGIIDAMPMRREEMRG